jgi:hypothetical protein
MTKKHFIEMARIIRDTIEKSKLPGRESSQASRALVVASETIALDMADYFAKENPSFNRSRFLKSAGVL